MTRSTLLAAFAMLPVCIAVANVKLWAQDDAALAEEAAPGLLANEPQTAEETFEAALSMLRVSRPDLAQRYLRKLLEFNPDDETLLRIREQYGTVRFLQLAQSEELHPESQVLLERIEQAAANQLQDPAYLDSLIAGLRGTPRERDAALRDLKHFGADVVPEILARLGAGADFADQDLLLFSLVRLGPIAVDPLLGALETPDPRTRTAAIDALGWIGDESIVPRLWFYALGSDQPQLVQQAALRAMSRIRYGEPHLIDRLDPVGAADEVFQRAVQHFSGEYNWPTGTDGTLDLWTWDTNQNRLVKTATSPASASMLMAERLARQAMLMAPERDQYRALFLSAALAHSRYRAGWDQPLPIGPGTAFNLALFSGPEMAELALGLAIEHGNAAAAVGVASALGVVGSRDFLRPHADRPPALIAALDFPNNRVQFEAASAILQIGPVQSFPMAHRVIEILARALRTDSGPRSVIIDPNTNRAVDTANLLNRLGYTTTVSLTGKDGFCEATRHGDVALAVLHPNTIRWELSQTIANFRADSRTAGIPIIIVEAEAARADMLRVLERVPSSTFVSTDRDLAHWQAEIGLLVSQSAAPPLTPQQQGEQMQAAAAWLRQIAEASCENVFDLASAEAALSDVAAHPLVAHDAIAALGAIGRPSVQQRFVDIILAPAIDAEIRAAAARQLARHIQRHGRLLTEASVAAITDAWVNAGDAAVRTALSAVLGSLGTTPQAVLDKLVAHPLPDVPQP